MSFSSACAISEEDTNSFIITGGRGGGSDAVSTVSRYNIRGHVEDLPSLKVPRQGHGCSSFMKDGKRASVLYCPIQDCKYYLSRCLLLPGA